MGPDGIPIEVWRSLGDVAIVWLTKFLTLSSHRIRCPMSGGGAFWYQSSRTRGCVKLY
jgi:hypothetical protein